MSNQSDLLKERFQLNSSRIDNMVNLIFSDIDQLKPTGVFESNGVRADILRSIVVFLHATFEEVLRSHISKPNKTRSFYRGSDIEKALRQSGIDSEPFKYLYKPLIQMATRRVQIVHYADIPNKTDLLTEKWSIADEWQLIMWLMAVKAFYYQFQVSIGQATAQEVIMYEKIKVAMNSHADFGNKLLSFFKVPAELRTNALKETLVILDKIINTLKIDTTSSL